MTLKLDELMDIDLVEIMALGAAISSAAAVMWTMKHELIQKAVSGSVELVERQIDATRNANLKRDELRARLMEEGIKQAGPVMEEIVKQIGEGNKESIKVMGDLAGIAAPAALTAATGGAAAPLLLTA